MVKVTEIHEFELEDAYSDWQELIYFNGDQDAIDKLEKKYYEIFEKVSSQSDFFTWSYLNENSGYRG